MRTLVGLVFMGLALTACAPGPTKVPTAPADAVEQQAQPLLEAGEYDAAATLFLEAAAVAAPPRAAVLRLRAAELLIEDQQPQAAEQVLDTIGAQDLSGDGWPRWQLAKARIAWLRGRPEEAIAAAPQDLQALAPAQRKNALALLAQAHEVNANYLEAAQLRVQMEPLLEQPAAIDENHEAIWRNLLHLSAEALVAVPRQPPPDRLTGWLELAEHVKRDRRQPRYLMSYLQQWRLRFPDHPAAADFLDQLLERVQTLQQRPQTLALLLPEDGPLSAPATAVREGFLAAYYEDSSAEKTARVRMYDTARDGALEAYRRALAEGAQMIVGPLDKDAVTELARLHDASVPVLALNYTDPPDLESPDSFYQYGLLPEDEAGRMAAAAAAEGHRQALVLVPQGPWGERMERAFREHFLRQGGRVLDSATYDSGESDYSQALKTLLHLDQSNARYQSLRRALRRSLEFEPRRRQDVDVIFLAAFPQSARLMIPQLRFFRATGVPVFATSHIFAGSANPQMDRDLNGVWFCDTPWTLRRLNASPSQEADSGGSQFSRLFAMGRDAYVISSELQWLREDPDEVIDGDTGRLSLGPQRRIHRDLPLARFVAGKPQPLELPSETAPWPSPATP